MRYKRGLIVLASTGLIFFAGCTSKKYDGAYFVRDYKNQKPVSKDVTTALTNPYQGGAAIISGGPEIVLAKKQFVNLDEDAGLVADYERLKANELANKQSSASQSEVSNVRKDASIYANKNKKAPIDTQRWNGTAKSSAKSSVKFKGSSTRSAVSSSSVSSQTISNSSSSSVSSGGLSTSSQSSSSRKSILPLGAQSIDNSFDPRAK